MRGKYEIRIEKLVYGGEGLGHHHGKVVFVPFSAPGDRLVVRDRRARKGYSRADILEVLESGSVRRPPFCQYFQRCGGCHWQHLPYSWQVEAKRSILEEIFNHRFPETRDLLISIHASAAEYGYRSRARLQIQKSSKGYSVGFHRPRSHAVEDILSCPLFRPALNAALGAIRERFRAAATHSAPTCIEIACSQETQTWTSAVYEPAEERGGRRCTGKRDTVERDILYRNVRGLQYAVSASAFFQANDFLLPDLVASVVELAKESEARSAVDLYCGVGLFTLPLALVMDRVTAVENSAIAGDLCAENALQNGLVNIDAIQANVGDWLQSRDQRPGEGAQLVLLNPPRAGAGSEVIRSLASLKPPTIIYVSCDPLTLARDLATLREHQYRLDFVEGFDLFPQTYHFETVVRLRRG